MDKFSELKAAAMAATPGPWISGDDSWSDGDNANISTEERYDSGIINIAQVDGGGSESGLDEPFSTEQQANAAFIAAANPAVVLALLADLEAKDEALRAIAFRVSAGGYNADSVDAEVFKQKIIDGINGISDVLVKRLAELESANKSQDDHINQQQDRIDSLEKKNGDLGRSLGAAEKLLATPVRLPKRWDVSGQVNPPRIVEVQFEQQNRTHDQCAEAIRTAGFTFTVEGDE